MHEGGEGIEFSKKTMLDVASIFRGFGISKIRETGLSLHFTDEEMANDRYIWKNSGPSDLSSIAVQSFTADRQNTDEEGVFISQNALELNNQGRSLLNLDSTTMSQSISDDLVDIQFAVRYYSACFS